MWSSFKRFCALEWSLGGIQMKWCIKYEHIMTFHSCHSLFLNTETHVRWGLNLENSIAK